MLYNLTHEYKGKVALEETSYPVALSREYLARSSINGGDMQSFTTHLKQWSAKD